MLVPTFIIIAFAQDIAGALRAVDKANRKVANDKKQ